MQFEPRKMDFGDIIDSAVKLFTRNFVPLVIIIAIFYGPMYFAGHYMDAVFADTILGEDFLENLFKGFESATDVETNIMQFDEFIADDKNFNLLMLSQLLVIVLSIIAPIGTLSGINYLSARIHGKAAGIGEAIAAGVKKYPIFLVVMIVLSFILGLIFVPIFIGIMFAGFAGNILIAVTMILLLFPVVIVLMLLLFAYTNILTCVIALEKVGIFEAYSRAFYLIKGFIWRTIGILILINLIVGIITVIFSQIGQSIGGMIADSSVRLATIASIGTLFSLIFQPVMLCAVFLVYLDIRIRKENYDLEILTKRSQADSADSAQVQFPHELK